MTPREMATKLKIENTTTAALSIAESNYKKLKEVNIAYLPNLSQIASDSYISDTLKKSLLKQERNKAKELQYETAFWQNVAGILRKQG